MSRSPSIAEKLISFISIGREQNHSGHLPSSFDPQLNYLAHKDLLEGAYDVPGGGKDAEKTKKLLHGRHLRLFQSPDSMASDGCLKPEYLKLGFCRGYRAQARSEIPGRMPPRILR